MGWIFVVTGIISYLYVTLRVARYAYRCWRKGGSHELLSGGYIADRPASPAYVITAAYLTGATWPALALTWLLKFALTTSQPPTAAELAVAQHRAQARQRELQRSIAKAEADLEAADAQVRAAQVSQVRQAEQHVHAAVRRTAHDAIARILK